MICGKRLLTRWSMALAILTGIALVQAGSASAGIPGKFNYQGRLTSATSGAPLPGSHDLTFRIYDDPTGGSLLWTEGQTVIADSAGVFSAILGTYTPVEMSLDAPVWLEVEVAGETLVPRREIVSVPFAFTARKAGSAARSDSLGSFVPGDFVRQGQESTVSGVMITDGEITDGDIAADAGIDASKIAGTAWTSENDGESSGLDSDMIDGLHATAFAGSVHNHSDIYFTKDELHTEGVLNDSGNPVHWTRLTGVPGGFADGVDDAGGAGDGHSLDAVDGDPVDVVYVNAAGDVGIGITNPGIGKLEVATATGTSIVGTNNQGVGVYGFSDDGTGILGVSNNGMAAAFVGKVYVSATLAVGKDTAYSAVDVANCVNTDSCYSMDGVPILSNTGRGNIMVGQSAGASITGEYNTILGDEAGINNESGYNTLIGYRAGYTGGFGWANTFVGSKAGYYNEGGSSNTFVGEMAGNHNISGVQNTYVGSGAGNDNTTGQNNVFVGARAGYSNSSSYNTFVGQDAGYNNETGSSNTFLGQAAGRSNIGGRDNTFVGFTSGSNNESGQYNTFVGSDAGHSNVSGEYNTFVGIQAGYANGSGNENTYLGAEAGDGASGKSFNTYLGYQAGYLNWNGDSNTYVGYQAGLGSWSANSVFIGREAGRDEHGSDKLYIANGPDTSDVLIYGDFSNGRIGLGTLNPQRNLHVYGDNPRILVEARTISPEINLKITGDASSEVWAFYKHGGTGDLRFYQGGDKVTIENSTGNVAIGTDNPAGYKLYVQGNAYTTGSWLGSDLRYKKDIEAIDGALDKVMALRGVLFSWRNDEYPQGGFPEGRHHGVIAQEVEQVLPEAVREDADGGKAVAYSELVPVLIEAVKAQQARIECLEKELRELKAGG